MRFYLSSSDSQAGSEKERQEETRSGADATLIESLRFIMDHTQQEGASTLLLLEKFGFLCITELSKMPWACITDGFH